MKAAVVFQRGERPKYITDYPTPVATGQDEITLSVKAAAIKNLDKSRASGQHYSTQGRPAQATIPGGDGVGLLPDGSRVYALGITGMLAEKAVVNKSRTIPLPADIDNITAAALPNAVAGSAMALRFSAQMEAGAIILINGATGFTGSIAVQIAKYYGAGRVIVTGRNKQSLEMLTAIGADEYIVIGDDEAFSARLKEIHQHSPIDIVLDYLWGNTAVLILEALKGTGHFTHKTRFVSIGSMTGETIELSSQILRSVNLQLSGSGLGSWTKEEVNQLLTHIIPEMFELAAAKRLQVNTTCITLENIEQAWDTEIASGQRLVVTI
ncbi:quinone oxidoreductase family protein [Filimonas effusa]|uniref:Zinc-binding alcohol dehydrogenase family protein n=1 Tax=Filimonas effusa TaxID=2508721 RepID=A0A4Q1D9E7_9BACT|nr:zinc-binding alcohol dehydrogenase family protein [Filimonas effusa]RXK85458.1 zinc-binding alcohol dehydrogenase family protein [Filimonas effusa]